MFEHKRSRIVVYAGHKLTYKKIQRMMMTNKKIQLTMPNKNYSIQ